MMELRQILSSLDIPELEPVPRDHVLTKTFYLLRDFPGRFDGGQLWVEALPSATQVSIPGVDHFATPSDFGVIDATMRFLGLGGRGAAERGPGPTGPSEDH